MLFHNFCQGVGSGMALDNGYELNFSPVTFNDFPTDNFIDFIVIAFYQNIGFDFSDESFWSGLAEQCDVVDIF